MSRTTIVVPCYNEAKRFDAKAFELALADVPGLEFLFVNDGSDDDTPIMLRAFEEKHAGRVQVIDLAHNRGKSHAVRAGMLAALAGDATYCGYWDADLATPLNEIPRFVEVLEARPLLELVIGSRVKLLGRTIERNPVRHYLGRISATVTSVLLDLQLGWLLAANGWVHRIRKGDETGDPSASEGDATKAAVTRQNNAPLEIEEIQVDESGPNQRERQSVPVRCFSESSPRESTSRRHRCAPLERRRWARRHGACDRSHRAGMRVAHLRCDRRPGPA